MQIVNYITNVKQAIQWFSGEYVANPVFHVVIILDRTKLYYWVISHSLITDRNRLENRTTNDSATATLAKRLEIIHLNKAVLLDTTGLYKYKYLKLYFLLL